MTHYNYMEVIAWNTFFISVDVLLGFGASDWLLGLVLPAKRIGKERFLLRRNPCGLRRFCHVRDVTSFSR